MKAPMGNMEWGKAAVPRVAGRDAGVFRHFPYGKDARSLPPTRPVCACVGESLPPAALEPIAQSRHVSQRRRHRRYLLPPQKEGGEKAAIDTPTVLRKGGHGSTTLYEPPEKPQQEENPGKAPSDACALSLTG